MEDQNQNQNQNSTTVTQNEPKTTTKEELAVVVKANNNDNNNAATDAVGVDAGSDTGARSEAAGSGQVVVKRGRGRPRKYEVGGNQLSPASAPPPGFAIQPFGGGDVKRGRGRPRGSGKLQILASIGGFIAETAGGSLTPHVLTVNTGEDVVCRIVSFFQRGPRAVCILSCTGTVSSVILRQPGASGGFLRYEGRFEILSLSGSCTYTSGAGGAQRKNGILSISLAKPDGRVFGGGLENSLIAASPIQLILATFKQNISNQIKKRHSSGSSSAVPNNSDSARDIDPLKVPKLTQGEHSCPSPTSALRLTAAATANGVADNNVITDETTTNGVSDNVTPEEDDHNNMNIDSVNDGGVDLECQTLQPVTEEQGTSPDVDASTVPQI